MLPDVSRLLAVRARDWSALAERFRSSGLDARWMSRVLRVGERVDDAMRAPMRLWTLRRSNDAAARLARLFVFGDALDPDEAKSALGDADPWLASGLVVPCDGGFVCPFRLALAAGKYFFADDLAASGDAVMGPSATTTYAILAARPRERVGMLLDVGCGAGAIAIALADRADRVVATDVNARALVLADVNLRLNAITNVELRRGDLFEPVMGERFDCIVSQPPFVARPPSEDAAPFLFGGARGDEIARRLLAGARDHLTEGGRAIALVDWPVVAGDPIDARVTGALVVASPARNLEDHCTLHAASAHPELGDAFSRAAIAMREHLEAQHVESLRLSVTIIERDTRPSAIVDVAHFADAPPSAESIERLVRAHALIAGDDAALLDARRRIPAGARFDAPPAIPDAPPVVIARLPRDRMLPSAAVDARVVACAERVAAAGSARVAGVDDASLADVRAALSRGVLEIDQ
ncbi:MAG TPA: methyltransferase [Polyangiaceae bacterium]